MFDELKKVVLTHVGGNLHDSRDLPLSSLTEEVRGKESTMGNLVADAVRHTFNAEIAIIQGGSIRGDSVYPAGTAFTMYDINREFPFANVASCYLLKGEEKYFFFLIEV